MDPKDVVERASRALHAEHLAYLGHLMSDDERAEFMRHLGAIMTRLADKARHPSTEDNFASVAEGLVEVAEYVESWRVSLLLALAPEWSQQVAESRELLEKYEANPDPSKLATLDDLRQLLRL